GVIKSGLGDKKGALNDYSQAININQNYAKAYYNRAGVKMNLKDKKGAIADLTKAAELFKDQGNESNYQEAINKIKVLSNN
ncbi:MAG TPA: tetratricopeptide repeat protein, partial [Allocoleopsis sp.]